MTKKHQPPKGKLFDLSHEIDTAFDPWTCPVCGVTYSPSCVVYISPIDYQERCPSCADKAP